MKGKKIGPSKRSNEIMSQTIIIGLDSIWCSGKMANGNHELLNEYESRLAFLCEISLCSQKKLSLCERNMGVKIHFVVIPCRESIFPPFQSICFSTSK